MNIPKNMVLWAALAIPVLMILFVALAIYWPQIGVKDPQYNFLYALRNRSDGYTYTIANGKLTATKITDEEQRKYLYNDQLASPTRFFLYDVATNTSTEISLEKATALKLDNSLTSPDGYELRRGGRGGGVFPFFFENGNYDDQFLIKGNHNKKLELKKGTNEYYYTSFEFFGWIIS